MKQLRLYSLRKMGLDFIDWGLNWLFKKNGLGWLEGVCFDYFCLLLFGLTHNNSRKFKVIFWVQYKLISVDSFCGIMLTNQFPFVHCFLYKQQNTYGNEWGQFLEVLKAEMWSLYLREFWYAFETISFCIDLSNHLYSHRLLSIVYIVVCDKCCFWYVAYRLTKLICTFYNCIKSTWILLLKRMHYFSCNVLVIYLVKKMCT